MLKMCIYTYSKDKISFSAVLEIVAMPGENLYNFLGCRVHIYHVIQIYKKATSTVA